LQSLVELVDVSGCEQAFAADLAKIGMALHMLAHGAFRDTEQRRHLF
jgi:hypothetical protein